MYRFSSIDILHRYTDIIIVKYILVGIWFLAKQNEGRSIDVSSKHQFVPDTTFKVAVYHTAFARTCIILGTAKPLPPGDFRPWMPFIGTQYHNYYKTRKVVW